MHYVMVNTNKCWRVPALLLAFGAISVLLGALQLNQVQRGLLGGRVPIDYDSMHYFDMPIPIVLHIGTGILFNLLGPFQFAPVIRQRWPGWHIWSGRVLFVSGVLVALTGLWMNHYFPWFGGLLKYSAVFLFSVGLLVSLAIALRAILGRDVQRHRAWMMRAFAIGLGPVTQRVIVIPLFVISGYVSELTIALIVWIGFLLNLLVVEWVLLRERRHGFDFRLGSGE